MGVWTIYFFEKSVFVKHPNGGSVWVMGEWAVGYWIVGVTSFQKIYGLYGLKHHILEISGDVTDMDRRTNKRTTSKDRATQLLIREQLSFAIIVKHFLLSGPRLPGV